MDHIAPSLSLLYSLKRNLSRQLPLREALSIYINENSSGWGASLSTWMTYAESGQLESLPELGLTSDCQKAILSCLEAGIRGQPIQRQLEELIVEAETSSQLEIDEYIARLPLKALTPIFLFQFPAFLLLIFGPVLSQLIYGVNNGI